MTKERLAEDLAYLANQAKMNVDGLTEHINFCIENGLSDFWNCYGWSWRTRPYSLSITTEAEQYVLPDDFAGIRTVRQKTSTYGGEVVYMAKEQFDREYPKATDYTSGYPQLCTTYYDKDNEAWYIKFMRVPEVGTTVYIDMYTTTSAIEDVPDGFESGLMASVEKYLYPLGSAERFSAQKNYREEVSRLKATDSPFRGHLTQMLQPPRQIVEPWGVRTWFGS
jgi:hypothetical protein